MGVPVQIGWLGYVFGPDSFSLLLIFLIVRQEAALFDAASCICIPIPFIYLGQTLPFPPIYLGREHDRTRAGNHARVIDKMDPADAGSSEKRRSIQWEWETE